MESIKNVNFLNHDIFDTNSKDKIMNYFKGNLDAIISDSTQIPQEINT